MTTPYRSNKHCSSLPTFLGLLALALLSPLGRADESSPPPLAIGAAAPDFCLPGIDGQTHCLAEYASSKVLVIAFTCNHCPTAQLYETRLKQLAADYRERGVTLVAIQPNSPNAVRLDELGYTDLGDSFDDMKVRAAYRHFNFPYLYDGETQKVARAYGPAATPHLFIFDAGRKLRYQGRVDNNPRGPLVTRRDARLAIDAILAGKSVEVEKTPSVGCSTKWLYKEEGRKKGLAEIESKPVQISPASAEDLKALRKNPTGKLLLVNFWATWCAPCVQEMPEIQTMYRMYGHRAFDVATVSVNYPDEQQGALASLTKLHATTRNLILGSTDLYALLAAFDPDWNAAVPYSMLLRPNGEVVYKLQGAIDPLEMRRLIIANLPDDDYLGHQAYWRTRTEQ
ncbi:MAG TPA: redoxin domain-containing protein [Candidatus Acidoferrum sp.]|nr:redoxin domain-containing protein [Candidatus Acidoferrum sp.]